MVETRVFKVIKFASLPNECRDELRDSIPANGCYIDVYLGDEDYPHPKLDALLKDHGVVRQDVLLLEVCW
mgnify:CR=1 FL=1